MPKRIKFSSTHDKNFKILSNKQFYQYLIHEKLINQEICGHCNKIIKFENIRKVNAQSVEYYFSQNQFVCSSSCSSSLSNIQRYIEHPELKGKGFENIIQGTLEKRFGKEKADEIKKKQSLKVIGDLNPNAGGKYSTWKPEHNTLRKGKTYSEIYGDEKAKEISQKISKASFGENNPMFGKDVPKKAGNGISGYYHGFYFRSLLELSYVIFLRSNNILYELPKRINYELEGIKRTYIPDFYLPETNEYIEIKAKNFLNTKENKAKFKAATNQFSKFTILTEDDIIRINKDFLIQLINNKLVKLDNKKLCNAIQP